jgi:hypothetical protein
MNVNGQGTMLAVNMPNKFVAVLLRYNGTGQYNAIPYFTTDGQTWTEANTTTGYAWKIFDIRTSGLFYNGTHFICFMGTYTTSNPYLYGWNYVQYSSDGYYWYQSTWSNNDVQLYQNSLNCANSRVSLFAHDNGPQLVRMSNSLLLYSPQDPNKWYPINVTWFTGHNWSSKVKNVDPTTIVTSGRFFVYTVNMPQNSSGFTLEGQFTHFISWDGINWVQSNIGTAATHDQISFNVGKYIYCGKMNTPSAFNRSFDGYNWITSALISLTNFNTISAVQGTGPCSQQNITGIAFNSGYYFCGYYSYNGSTKSLTQLYNTACNNPFTNLSFVRSVSNSPTSFMFVNRNDLTVVYYTNNNFNTVNNNFSSYS